MLRGSTAPVRTKQRSLLIQAKTQLKRAWPVFGRKDWKPKLQVQAINARDGQFLSTGADPQLKLAFPHAIRAGWYMLEVKLRLPSTFAEAKLYPDMGEGESDATAIGLPIRTEKLAKRLVYLPSAAVTLRFDPMDVEGAFTVQHLRLARVSESFALKRMRQKLAARHSAYAPNAKQKAQPGCGQQLWIDYCKLFELAKHRHQAISYVEWIINVETPKLLTRAAQATEIATWTWKPRFSIITPVYNTDASALRNCLESVLAQSYGHWELCIVDDASSAPHIRRILSEYAARDVRIKVNYRSENGHIVQASNTALNMATGEFIVLLDHDDVLAPHALHAVARALQSRPTAQLVYSDEDKLDINGERCSPYFKPDFSPDLLYSQNYFCHMGVYRRELVQAAGGFRKGYEGSQDYDLVLRCVERISDLRDVLHIPQVLYHWRMVEGSTANGHVQKPYATEAARKALQDHFDSQGLRVLASVDAAGIYRHRWPIPDPAPLVSLIIPTRNGYGLLKTCIDSIVQRTSYTRYEILIVDNQSTCKQTLAYLDELAALGCARVLRYDHPFNYSAINNFAARQAKGSLLGLVNNDIEVISPDWLSEMVSHAVRVDIGCVGAKLYYPDDTIQHGGVVLGIGGVAGHSHKYYQRVADGYFSRLRVVHNVSAVTGAVLILRKHLFDAVGGLDETGLPVAFNDVDLCLKVMGAGYRNLWTPFAELYHHESVSRNAEDTPEKQARFHNECEVMRQRWGTLLATDPYYNPNLSLLREDYSFSTDMRMD